MKCKSCGSERWIEATEVVFCPECGSRELELELLPEQISEISPKISSSESLKSDSIESSEVFKEPRDPLRLSPPYQSPQVQKPSWSGTRTGKNNDWQIRLVVGVIGVIMLFSAAGLAFSALPGILGGSFGGVAGLITLGVIGVILLAIATKGECCNC